MEIHLDSIDFDTIIVKDKSNNEIKLSIQDELRIDEVNLNKAFMEQSSKYAWWGNLSEIVKRYHEAEQRKLDTLGAQLNLSIREWYKQNKEKPTKDMIESRIMIDKNYQEQLKVVEEWSYKYNQLNSVVKAFQQRVNALTHLGAEQRLTNKDKVITSPYSY